MNQIPRTLLVEPVLTFIQWDLLSSNRGDTTPNLQLSTLSVPPFQDKPVHKYF